MNEDFDRLLASAESTLAGLQAIEDQVRGFALQFGDQVGKIGRALTQHPELAPKVRAFVECTAPLIARNLPLGLWIGWVYDAAESRSSDTDDYRDALAARSDLEFFLDLYRDSVARNYLAGIETESTDEDLKEWGAHHHIDEVPPGIPPSHVWWHRSRSGK
jgi:hypothetical protein